MTRWMSAANASTWRLLSLGGEDTAKTLRKVARVVQDLGGTVIWADEKQERN